MDYNKLVLWYQRDRREAEADWCKSLKWDLKWDLRVSVAHLPLGTDLIPWLYKYLQGVLDEWMVFSVRMNEWPVVAYCAWFDINEEWFMSRVEWYIKGEGGIQYDRRACQTEFEIRVYEPRKKERCHGMRTRSMGLL